uniref:Uncharacterized protein n=1 Tax=Parascaris equorum TaxID=6256 RepID=A0A914R490_PAREQ
MERVRCVYTGVVPEILRGVKFDVHRVDNMVIQSIALLDQLDKDINLFGMRIREWSAPFCFMNIHSIYWKH